MQLLPLEELLGKVFAEKIPFEPKTHIDFSEETLLKCWQLMVTEALSLDMPTAEGCTNPKSESVGKPVIDKMVTDNASLMPVPDKITSVADFEPLGMQTQMQILDQWRSEFETPVSKKVADFIGGNEFGSQPIFDVDWEGILEFDEDEFADIPSQFFKMTQALLPMDDFPMGIQIHRDLTSIKSPYRFLSNYSPSGIKRTAPLDSTSKAMIDSPMKLVKAMTFYGADVAEPLESGRIQPAVELDMTFSDIPLSQSDPSPMTLTLDDEERLRSTKSFIGFATASGKKIESPSKAAKQKADAIIGSIYSGDPLQYDATGNANGNIATASTTAPSTVSFKTASGKTIKSPSKAAREKSEAIINSVQIDSMPDSDIEFATASGQGITPPSEVATEETGASLEALPVASSGFTTASGKKITSPSKASRNRAEAIMNSVNGERSHEESAPNISMPLFQTASKKPIPTPSKAAVDRANTILDSVQNEILATSPKGLSLSLFTSASGKSLKPPSKEAIAKASSILQSHDLPAENCPMERRAKPLIASVKQGVAVDREDWRSKIQKAPPSKEAFSHRTSTNATATTSPLVLTRLKPAPKTHKRSPSAPFKPPSLLPLSLQSLKSPLVSTESPNKGVLAKEFDMAVPCDRQKLSDYKLMKKLPSKLGVSIDGSLEPRCILEALKTKFPIAKASWLENHLYFVIWKLFAYHNHQTAFTNSYELTGENIINQISYRYGFPMHENLTIHAVTCV